MRSLQLHGHSWQTPLVCVLLSVALSGCIVDARPPYTRFVNHLDTPVTFTITGTDEVLELGPGEDFFIGEEEGCIGDGLVVTSAEGIEFAVYEGAICTDTSINVWRDERGVTVSDDGERRLPLSTSPSLPVPAS